MFLYIKHIGFFNELVNKTCLNNKEALEPIMAGFCLISALEYPKNANFHQKLILLLRKHLFKICNWEKSWYIQCQYKLNYLIWQNQRRI